MTDIRIASADDASVLGRVLGAAFTDDPLMAWAWPDSTTRPARMNSLFGWMAEHVYLPAECCTVAGSRAGALWMPPGGAPGDEFWDEHGGALAEAMEFDMGRIGEVSAVMHENHPTESHHYLLAIGVSPSDQGQGWGGRLLDFTLERTDAAGLPSYLEATSARSRVLYERHGFEVTAELHADDSPPFWAMWRKPVN